MPDEPGCAATARAEPAQQSGLPRLRCQPGTSQERRGSAQVKFAIRIMF